MRNESDGCYDSQAEPRLRYAPTSGDTNPRHTGGRKACLGGGRAETQACERPRRSGSGKRSPNRSQNACASTGLASRTPRSRDHRGARSTSTAPPMGSPATMCTSSLFLRPRTFSAGARHGAASCDEVGARDLALCGASSLPTLRRSPAPGRDQLCLRNVEMLGALLEGVAFVGRLDVAHQDQPVSGAVDCPGRRRSGLRRGVGRRTFCHAASIGQAAGILPPITGCKLQSSRLRKRLPADLRVSPRRVLQRRAPPTARRAPCMLAQHVGRRIGAPPDHERHKRDSNAVTAGITAKPKPVRLMQQCTERRHRDSSSRR